MFTPIASLSVRLHSRLALCKPTGHTASNCTSQMQFIVDDDDVLRANRHFYSQIAFIKLGTYIYILCYVHSKQLNFFPIANFTQEFNCTLVGVPKFKLYSISISICLCAHKKNKWNEYKTNERKRRNKHQTEPNRTKNRLTIDVCLCATLAYFTACCLCFGGFFSVVVAVAAIYLQCN